MPSLNDLVFIFWLVICYYLILITPGKLNRGNYGQLMAGIFILSCLAITWFHETVIDISQSSPIHGAILGFAQVGTLALTLKIWLSIHYQNLKRWIQILLQIVLFGSLFVITSFSYWLYKFTPELQLLLYPLASLAISLAAEMIEERWAQK